MNQTDDLATFDPLAERSGTKRKIGLGLLIMALILALMLTFGVFDGIRSRVDAAAVLERAAQVAAIPIVEVVHPKPVTGGQEIALPGNVEAFNDTPIYARTSGYLQEWYVDIGARVQQGQLLALIQAPELDQQLRQARADLTNAEANLEIAQITSARWQNLLKANAVSQQETDQAVSNLKVKQAIAESSKAAVDRLEQLRAFERITAPFDGVITARSTDIGALIQAGDNSPGKELFHLAAIGKLRVYFPVPEIYAASVRNDDSVKVILDAFPNEQIIGTVVRNSHAIDRNSRTLNVEVDIDNPGGRMFPGAYALVHIKAPASRSAVAIPSNALLFRAEGLCAGVVHNGHVVLKSITIGQDYGSSVEVVSGLSTGDSVIVNPSDSLVDGAAVRVRAKPVRTVGP